MPVKYNLPKKKLQPFIDNSFISFDKTDNFFLTATCSVLFEVTFLLMLLVYYQNPSVLQNQQYHFCLLSLLVLILACFNLDVDSLIFLVIIFTLWLEIIFSISLIFVFKSLLVTNLLTSGILFSTPPVFKFKELLVTNLLTSGIFFWYLLFFSLSLFFLYCTRPF